MNLVPPVATGSSATRWTVTLHPCEAGQPSKTREFNQSLALDLERQRELGPSLERRLRARRRPGGGRRHAAAAARGDEVPPLFAVNQKDVNTFFRDAARRFGLDRIGVTTLYQLRHGGASFDVVSPARSLGGIRRRGRWRSWGSMRRYEKGP